MALPKPRKWLIAKNQKILLIISLILIGVLIYSICRFTETEVLKKLRSTGTLRTGLYTASLLDTLDKYRHIPYILSRDTRIRGLLNQTTTEIKVSQHLEDFGHKANALIYVMDARGNTVASSNWRTKQSLVHSNFAFRPYFQDAQKGKSGTYFAVGVMTRKAGLFISYPVFESGIFLGVVVVKAALDKLENDWRNSDEIIYVSDSYGVLFLSSRNKWKYTSLRKLPKNTIKLLQKTQYLDKQFPTLNHTRKIRNNDHILSVNGQTYLEHSVQLPEYGWRLHYLSDLSRVQNAVRLAFIVATASLTTLFLIMLYLRERRQKIASRREAQEAVAIKKLNELLKTEIFQRREAELSLKQTQDNLIQAEKLVALGKMSAAIAHELNQPVAAIRTFIASCNIFLERNQLEKVRENINYIMKLTDRMSSITGQLKTFSRKNKHQANEIELLGVLKKTISLMQPQMKDHGIEFNTDLQIEENIHVYSNSTQIEQILNNLFYNAIDALQDSETKKINLTCQLSHNDDVLITLHDTGSGFTPQTLKHIFDPFFTTKDIGEGLGLGLSITYGIIQELGGSITAENHVEKGALFTVQLPIISQSI